MQTTHSRIAKLTEKLDKELQNSRAERKDSRKLNIKSFLLEHNKKATKKSLVKAQKHIDNCKSLETEISDIIKDLSTENK